MNKRVLAETSRDDFEKARKLGRFQTVLSALQWKRPELLSLYEVTKLIKPKKQTYLGMKTIEVKKIIGSEGRYHDFTLAFYPKKDMLRGRWESIDKAHYEFINLPPISVYKLGDNYFVRDGNHRVSVAKAQGVEFIDAEVVELDSQIKLEAGMTMRQIKKEVIKYERKQFIKHYHPDKYIDMDTISFTSTGMYPELAHHILEHKYYINMNRKDEISFGEAITSWYNNVYAPIVKEIEEERVLASFPGKTKGDLYMWIVRHWDHLKATEGTPVSIHKASVDYKERFGKGKFKRWIAWFKERLTRE